MYLIHDYQREHMPDDISRSISNIDNRFERNQARFLLIEQADETVLGLIAKVIPKNKHRAF